MPWKEYQVVDERLRFVARLPDTAKTARRPESGGWRRFRLGQSQEQRAGRQIRGLKNSASRTR